MVLDALDATFIAYAKSRRKWEVWQQAKSPGTGPTNVWWLRNTTSNLFTQKKKRQVARFCLYKSSIQEVYLLSLA